MQKLWEKLPQNISMINVLRLRLLVSSVLLINMTSLCYITRRHITWLLYVRDVILHNCVTWRSWRHFTQLCYVTFMTSHYVMLRYMTSHDTVMLCLLRHIRHTSRYITSWRIWNRLYTFTWMYFRKWSFIIWFIKMIYYNYRASGTTSRL